MAKELNSDRVSLEELMASTLVMIDALAKLLLIDKGVITDQEFKSQLGAEKANYLAVLKRMHYESLEDLHSGRLGCQKMKSRYLGLFA